MCGDIVIAEHTDFICISPSSHGGEHEYVDAMGFVGLDASGKPIYRDGFNYAR